MSVREWWREEEATPEPEVPARLPGEALYAYLERIAVGQGWMAPLRKAKPVERERVPGEDDE